MSIKIKSIACPSCGSTETEQISNGKYKCSFCDSTFIINDESEKLNSLINEGKIYLKDLSFENADECFTKALSIDENCEIAEIGKSLAKNKLYIIENDISKDQAINIAMKGIYNQKKLVPDFFSKIKINSIEESFYIFVSKVGTYNGNVSAMSCFKRQEEYYNPRTQRREKREVIDRTPFSGSYSTVVGSAFSSASFCKKITEKEITAFKDSKIHSNSNYKVNLFETTEFRFESEMTGLIENARGIDIDSIKIENDIYKYNGIPLNLEFDDNAVARVQDLFSEKVGRECKNAAEYTVPGDFHEKFSCNITSQDEHTMLVLVPIQIIDFSYNGSKYKTVQVLNSKYHFFITGYPANSVSIQNENNIQQKINILNDTMSKYSDYEFKVGFAGVITAVIVVIYCFWNGVFLNGGLEDYILAAFIAFSPFLAIIIILYCISKKIRIKSEEEINKENQKESEYQSDMKSILKKSYDSFKKVFNKDYDCAAANSAAKDAISGQSQEKYSFTGVCSSGDWLKQTKNEKSTDNSAASKRKK